MYWVETPFLLSQRKFSSFLVPDAQKISVTTASVAKPDHEVPRNSEIRLRFWPVRLQNVCPLELVVRGPLLRTDRNGSVLRSKSLRIAGDMSGKSLSIPASVREIACSPVRLILLSYAIYVEK